MIGLSPKLVDFGPLIVEIYCLIPFPPLEKRPRTFVKSSMTQRRRARFC